VKTGVRWGIGDIKWGRKIREAGVKGGKKERSGRRKGKPKKKTGVSPNESSSKPNGGQPASGGEGDRKGLELQGWAVRGSSR